MATRTTNLELYKPADGDAPDISKNNWNMDKLDTEVASRVKTVNGTAPGTDGNVAITHVDWAGNLETGINKRIEDAFIMRTTGGTASVSTGTATLRKVLGNRVRIGHVDAVGTMTVTMTTREAGEDEIDATLDLAAFETAVENVTGTYTFDYVSDWSDDPAEYGITVMGTPKNGDQITVAFTAEVLGTIVQCTPAELVSTGWNLYNSTTGRAMAVKYSDEFGYQIGGEYSAVKWSATEDSAKQTLTVDAGGNFSVPADGVIWVSDGDDTTWVALAWSTGRTVTTPDPYTESTVDLSDIMEAAFQDGLMQAGDVRDEIDITNQMVYAKIEKLENTAANMAEARASGRTFEFDDSYIYIEKAEWDVYGIALSGEYSVNDYGIEFFTETTVPVMTDVMYGQDLTNKLERDVVTISAQTLGASDQAQVRENIGAASAAAVEAALTNLVIIKEYSHTFTSLASGATKGVTASDMGAATPSGYRAIGLIRWFASASSVVIDSWRLDNNGASAYFNMRNVGNSAATNFTVYMRVAYVKSAYSSVQ